jgi:hypothetical protein
MLRIDSERRREDRHFEAFSIPGCGKAWLRYCFDRSGELARCERVVTSLPLPEPLLERLLALCRWPADEQILDADVFVEIWPVHSATLADEPPVTSLCDRAMKEAGIPGQRRRDGTTVGQLECQGVASDRHLCSLSRPGLNR